MKKITIKDFRFLLGKTQIEFFNILKEWLPTCNQGTISSWERGLNIPNVHAQKALNELMNQYGYELKVKFIKWEKD